MRILFILSLSFFFNTLHLVAQNYTLPLWENNIPNSKVSDDKETTDYSGGLEIIKNVQNPNIAVFLPSKNNATGEAVVICPGGGYWVLAYDWEGTDIAKALNAKGIAAIVLKYRLPNSNSNIVPHKTPLLDAKRAMKLTRHNAEAWNISIDKVGIMGFSAGGHLASTLSVHYDNGNAKDSDPIERFSSRPDFSILMYPVITFNEKYTHKGSVHALLGDNPSEELINYYSNELHVTENTPPTFLAHSSDDDVVAVKNSLLYYEALQENGVSTEIHIYPYGGHGFSLAINKGHLSNWIDSCTDWIEYTTNNKIKTQK